MSCSIKMPYMEDTLSEKLYTTEEVANILQVDPESIRRYVRSGELKSLLLGNKFIRIPKQDLDNFINQRKSNFQQLPPVKSGKIWHSPLNVYWHVKKLADRLGQDGLEKHKQYKLIRESQIAAVISLMMFRIRNIPAYVQLYKPDPPDALIMQPSPINKGELDISTLEITQYKGNNNESLFDQLKRTKIKPKINTLSSFYILVVDLWPKIVINEEELKEIRDYLIKNQTPFPVWLVQEKEKHPDTIAELTIVNPEIQKIIINLGESGHIYQKLGVPDVINTKRIGNKNLVRIEKAEKFFDPPWETIGK